MSRFRKMGVKKIKDIVDTALASDSFKTLCKAVIAAGLVDALRGSGPFTVFAPTDEAFAKLPAGTIDTLLKDKAKLTSILTYHVVAGKVMADDVKTLSSAVTVQGQDLSIDAKRWHLHRNVKVNGANVIKTDIECSNGVIHVIDQVLMPK